MAEEFQAGICGGNSWWTSSRHGLVASPCSVGFHDHMGGFGCPNDMVDIKATRITSSCGEINNSAVNLVSNGDFDHPGDVQNPHEHSDSGSGSPSHVLIDSTLQMIGFGLSSATSSTVPSDLNHFLLSRTSTGSGRDDENSFHNSMLQDDTGNSTKLNYGQDQMNQDYCLVDQLGSSSSSGFPIISSSLPVNSYGFPASTLMLQSLFDSEPQVPQSQQSLLINNHFSNDLLLSPSPPSTTTSCWPPPPPRYSPTSCLRPSSSLPKQLIQPAGGGGGSLHFSNNINTPFWNAPAAAAALNHDNVRSSASSGLFPSSQSQYTAPTAASPFHEHKPNSHNNFTTKANNNHEDVEDSSSVVKKSGSMSSSSCEPLFKRARIETPSPLPTFKVRKEKLGDRITALQQLVSPFGKTDTASVLHEAIEYIKFLHDQVSVLSTPYMKNGAPMQLLNDKMKDAESGGKEDLKSRGLCLVPISSTFPVANEPTADFWTPTFGATSFR